MFLTRVYKEAAGAMYILRGSLRWLIVSVDLREIQDYIVLYKVDGEAVEIYRVVNRHINYPRHQPISMLKCKKQ